MLPPGTPTISAVGLIALTVALVSLVPSIVGFVIQGRTLEKINRVAQENRALAVQGAEAHRGACALVADYADRAKQQQARIAASVQFLRAHPEGLGEITPDLIRAGIDRDRATLANIRSSRDALTLVIHCKPSELNNGRRK